ncbi:hypothetical protein EXS70_02255 [Candidatus Peribacteria bacterium]|nr:hypothetical protein [Candidatus Peribacteria bacterium]
MVTLPRFLSNPYALVVLFLLVVADISGIAHGFRVHGSRDGTIAIVLPPYGIYRAVESLAHPGEIDPVVLAESETGRRTLTAGLEIKPEVWTALLNLIAAQPNHSLTARMEEEGGVNYNITVTVPTTGPILLTVKPEQSIDKLVIEMSDSNRDQTPERIKVTKMVNGKEEVHDTPIEKFSTDDSSQFLLAWSLAWGTIAEEQKAKANPVSK